MTCLRFEAGRHGEVEIKTSKGLLSILAAFTCAISVAAPPAKPPPSPPSVDIAYLSISNNSWTGWPPAAIRGIAVSAAGASITDVEFWRPRNRYTASLAWDSSGRYLAWAESIDRRGTQALLVAEPGQAPRIGYLFSSDNIYSNNNFNDGLAVSPQGRILVAGAYSYELGDRGLVAQPLLAARYESDQAWIHSFDWSSNGRRLAISIGRWVPISAGSALAYDPELWIAEIDYVASAGAEQATVASLGHGTAGVTPFASWAPVIEGGCDRLAFLRSGSVWLFDVPRDGFTDRDCAVGSPADIGGDAVAALDWR